MATVHITPELQQRRCTIRASIHPLEKPAFMQTFDRHNSGKALWVWEESVDELKGQCVIEGTRALDSVSEWAVFLDTWSIDQVARQKLLFFVNGALVDNRQVYSHIVIPSEMLELGSFVMSSEYMRASDTSYVDCLDGLILKVVPGAWSGRVLQKFYETTRHNKELYIWSNSTDYSNIEWDVLEELGSFKHESATFGLFDNAKYPVKPEQFYYHEDTFHTACVHSTRYATEAASVLGDFGIVSRVGLANVDVKVAAARNIDGFIVGVKLIFGTDDEFNDA